MAFFTFTWLVLYFCQGFTWLVVGLTTSLKGECFSKAQLHILSILAFIFAGIFCTLALCHAIVNHEITVKEGLDVLCFVGACLILLCTYKGYTIDGSGEMSKESTLSAPLIGEMNGGAKVDSTAQVVTPFATAGLFSKMLFWWLNPLMKLGKQKNLEEEDIPKLRDSDRAESCYMQFMEQLSKQTKAQKDSSQSSILRTIVACYWREIMLTGFFALLKTVTVSAGPLLLKAFIQVAEGNEIFKYEGLILAIALFISKILDCHRDSGFSSRLIGIKVRSFLTAAIYKKQQRLSNAARTLHSGGEIMNYVTVDAYRICEFPYWFHQTWTTSLQLCIALLILIQSVGLATISALIIIILTVLCNVPLAKLQHKFQTKLMVAQDERLKIFTEALVSMKVLKLYAWETHFKKVIEGLRDVEYKWLRGVQLRRAYNGFIFWTATALVSAATFGTCYIINILLNASNVFTFVATLRKVQDPIRAMPDVLAVVIQAKVSFQRIVEFLDAPELQTDY